MRAGGVRFRHRVCAAHACAGHRCWERLSLLVRKSAHTFPAELPWNESCPHATRAFMRTRVIQLASIARGCSSSASVCGLLLRGLLLGALRVGARRRRYGDVRVGGRHQRVRRPPLRARQQADCARAPGLRWRVRNGPLCGAAATADMPDGT